MRKLLSALGILVFFSLANNCREYERFDEIRYSPDLIAPIESEAVYNSTPLLEWGSVEHSENYVVELTALELDFIDDSGELIQDIIQAPAVAYLDTLSYRPELASGEYVWRVKAHSNFQYYPSDWERFLVRLQPGTATLMGPTTTQTISQPTLSWTEAENATTYQVEISADADFTNILQSHENLSELELITDELEEGTYYWRVISSDNTNLTSTSEVFVLEINFPEDPVDPIDPIETGGPEVPPILLYPSSTQGVDPFEFAWAPSTDGQSYEIQIATDEAMTNIVDSASGLAGTTYTPSAPLGDGIYYWQVTGTDSESETLESLVWQVVIDTTTPTGVVPPIPTSPSVSVCTDTPEFTWDPASGKPVNNYDFEISTTPSFGADVIQNSNQTATTFTSAPLANGTFYWRVTANFADTTTAISNIYTLIVFKLEPPTLVGVSTPISDPYPNFIWDSISGTTEYILQISNDNFSTIFYTGDGITSTQFTYPTSEAPLAQDTYQWRVSGSNILCENGPWSSEGSFDIDPKFFIGTTNGLYVSIDGGTTFSKHTDPTEAKIMDVLLQGDEVWLAYDNGEIWKSTDRGNTFSAMTPIPGGQAEAITHFDSKYYVTTDLGNGAGRFPQITTDGGNTWSDLTNMHSARVVTGIYGDPSIGKVFMAGRDTGNSFCSGAYEGRAWTLDDSPFTGLTSLSENDYWTNQCFARGLVIMVSSADVVYMGLVGGVLTADPNSMCDGCFSPLGGYSGAVNDIREGAGGLVAATNNGMYRIGGGSLQPTAFTTGSGAVGHYAGKIWIGIGGPTGATSSSPLAWTDDGGTSFTTITFPETIGIDAIQHQDT